MVVVKMNEKYRCCATCALWEGPRSIEKGRIVFDISALGVCAGETFKSMQISAISTSAKWEPWQELHE
jgi:hypothetical protein